MGPGFTLVRLTGTEPWGVGWPEPAGPARRLRSTHPLGKAGRRQSGL